MSDSDPPGMKLRWYQFSLRTLLIATPVLSVLLGLSIWIYPTPNGEWEVVSIDEKLVGTWHGKLDDGTHIGGALHVYTATCRDGDRTRTFTLTRDSEFPRRDADLPLHRGDRFRIIQDFDPNKDADVTFLPGGVVVRKVTASE